jgi:hypothetical protein
MAALEWATSLPLDLRWEVARKVISLDAHNRPQLISEAIADWPMTYFNSLWV